MTQKINKDELYEHILSEIDQLFLLCDNKDHCVFTDLEERVQAYKQELKYITLFN